jgi:AraC-like DNA-binding protein
LIEGRRLFANHLMAIHSYACSGHDTPHGSEEGNSWYEIVLPRHGLYVYRLGKRELVANTNNACLIDADRSYRVHHPNGGQDATTIVSLGRRAFRQLLASFDPEAADCAEARLRFPTNQIGISPGLAFHHHRLLALAADSGDALLIEESAVGLCLEIARQSLGAARREPRGHRPQSADYYKERVSAVMIYLGGQCARPVSLTELSRVAAMSPFHLSRIFRAVAGLPIHRYLTHLRLTQTLERLRTGDENLTQIALDAGFSSHSHYTAAVRMAFGKTPSELRQSLRGRR